MRINILHANKSIWRNETAITNSLSSIVYVSFFHEIAATNRYRSLHLPAMIVTEQVTSASSRDMYIAIYTECPRKPELADVRFSLADFSRLPAQTRGDLFLGPLCFSTRSAEREGEERERNGSVIKRNSSDCVTRHLPIYLIRCIIRLRDTITAGSKVQFTNEIRDDARYMRWCHVVRATHVHACACVRVAIRHNERRSFEWYFRW